MLNSRYRGRLVAKTAGGILGSSCLLLGSLALGAPAMGGPFDSSHFLGYGTVEGNNARAFEPQLEMLGVVPQGGTWLLPSITCQQVAPGSDAECTYILESTPITATANAGSPLAAVFAALQKNGTNFAQTAAGDVVYGPARITCYSATLCYIDYDTGSYQHSYNVAPAYNSSLTRVLAAAGLQNSSSDPASEVFVAKRITCSGPEVAHRAPAYGCSIIDDHDQTIAVADPIQLAALLDEVQLRGSLQPKVHNRLDALVSVTCERPADDSSKATCSVVETIPTP